MKSHSSKGINTIAAFMNFLHTNPQIIVDARSIVAKSLEKAEDKVDVSSIESEVKAALNSNLDLTTSNDRKINIQVRLSILSDKEFHLSVFPRFKPRNKSQFSTNDTPDVQSLTQKSS